MQHSNKLLLVKTRIQRSMDRYRKSSDTGNISQHFPPAVKCAYYALKVSQICHDDTPLNVDTKADIRLSASHTAGLLYFPLQKGEVGRHKHMSLR
ncbi:hypothetical protein MHYP_G00186830 [Metynnis hypsauchen]